MLELTEQLKALQDDMEKQALRSKAQSAEKKVEDLTQKLEQDQFINPGEEIAATG